MNALLDAVGVDLATRFRGQLIGPDDSRYDEAREVYNAMIDKRPALIARCADVADTKSEEPSFATTTSMYGHSPRSTGLSRSRPTPCGARRRRSSRTSDRSGQTTPVARARGGA